MAIRSVIPASEARKNLASYLRDFRNDPAAAEPIVFGPQRNAEAVLVPIEQYRELLAHAEELALRAEVVDVMSKDTGQRSNVADLAREHGFDPAEFGLA